MKSWTSVDFSIYSGLIFKQLLNHFHKLILVLRIQTRKNKTPVTTEFQGNAHQPPTVRGKGSLRANFIPVQLGNSIGCCLPDIW